MENLMQKFELIAAIAAACPAGFTVNAQTMEPITTGYAVAVADTQNSFGNYGLAKVVAYTDKHDDINAIGGWLDTESGLYYYDATIVVNDLATARNLAKLNNQIAFFDLTNCKEIRL